MIIVVFSSSKDSKVKPVEQALSKMYPQGFISLRHRIGEKDTNIPSQPVGHQETELGAIQRAAILKDKKLELKNRLQEEKGIDSNLDDTWLFVGVEGGLILSERNEFSDVIYVALASDNYPMVTAPATPVILLDKNKTPYRHEGPYSLFDDMLYSEMSPSQKEERDLCIYGHPKGEAALKKEPPTFMGYRQTIVEPIIDEKKEDLYRWSTDNRVTRETAVHHAATRAVKAYLNQKVKQLESSLQQKTETKNQSAARLLSLIAEYGCVASLGHRYRDMVWIRDISFMAPTLIKGGHFTHVLEALRGFATRQETRSILKDDGYLTSQRFGKVPIVYVPDESIESFLENRIGSWQRALWQYCLETQNDALVNFPIPGSQYQCLSPQDMPLSQLDLSGLNAFDLKEYYYALVNFASEELAKAKDKPKASFSLRRFMSDELENLTPGTRDSEIHFLRAFLLLVEALEAEEEKQALFNEFAPSLARALIYLHTNTIDPQDWLPLGADSRDIFADAMYDAKTLSNACYYYQVLLTLTKHTSFLKESSFCSELANDLNSLELESPPGFLRALSSKKQIESALNTAKLALAHSIQTKLLYNTEAEFAPQDFIPGARINENKPEVMPLPSYVAELVSAEEPYFSQGQLLDPQGLALAVLCGLVEPKDYPKTIELFKACDSDIGIKVFTPISATSEHEKDVLKQNHGFVVWPNISYRVVQALRYINTRDAVKLAQSQQQKLIRLPEMYEWYAKAEAESELNVGGAPMQGWHGAGLRLPECEMSFNPSFNTRDTNASNTLFETRPARHRHEESDDVKTLKSSLGVS